MEGGGKKDRKKKKGIGSKKKDHWKWSCASPSDSSGGKKKKKMPTPTWQWRKASMLATRSSVSNANRHSCYMPLFTNKVYGASETAYSNPGVEEASFGRDIHRRSCGLGRNPRKDGEREA